MFKLNNKGMTTVEILVSFVLIATISATLFTTVSNFTTKRERENAKLQINTYKNLLTKRIQDDLIKVGVINAYKEEFVHDVTDVYSVTITLKNNEVKRLVVRRKLNRGYLFEEGSSPKRYDDEFHIYYGNPTYPSKNCQASATDCIVGLTEEMPFPDLGYGVNSDGYKVKDLRITNVNFSTANNVLSLFIGFDHVDLGTKYAINIVSPINYQ